MELVVQVKEALISGESRLNIERSLKGADY